MRLVRRPSKKSPPWCQCEPSMRGFIQHPGMTVEWWVHSGCLKPTKMYYRKLHHRLAQVR